MSTSIPSNDNREPKEIDPVDNLPADDTLPIEEIHESAIIPTDPAVETALDDDEGGADAIDPDTGLPYENDDAGNLMPPVTRDGGTEES